MQDKRNSGSRRVRAERGIYMRPGTAPVVYEITWSENGRQHWRTVEGGLREARAARGDAVARLARGERVTRTKLTLSEYADEWLAAQEGRLRPGTLVTYRDNLTRHVVTTLGRRKLASITVDDIAALIGELQRKRHVRGKDENGKPVEVPYAAWTIRGVLVVLGRLFGSAARAGHVPTNPVRQLERTERPKAKRAEFPNLDREAVGKLISATPAKYRMLVAVSVLLGLRQGEALGLQWRDVDMTAGVLHVRRQLDRRTGDLAEPKTDAAKRSIPLPPSLGKMLAAHRLASLHSGDADFVFVSSSGRPLAVRNITRRGLDKALTTTGLPRLRWHDLRHVAASALIADGSSVGYVSRLLGHSSPAITLSTYAHAFAAAEHDERTRERMEAAFGEVLAASGHGNVLERSDGKKGQTSSPANTTEPAPLRQIGSGRD